MGAPRGHLENAIALGMGLAWSIGFLFIAAAGVAHGSVVLVALGLLLASPGLGLVAAYGWGLGRKRAEDEAAIAEYQNSLVTQVAADGEIKFADVASDDSVKAAGGSRGAP